MMSEDQDKSTFDPQSIKRGKGRNFQQLSKVLPKVLRQLGLDNRLREHTFLNIWPHVIGEPFASRTRPLFIDNERNLVLAVRDSATGQEITFAKAELLRAINQAARGVGIEIKGMRFDMKRFYEGALSESQVELPAGAELPEPTEAELNEIALSADEVVQIGLIASSIGPEQAPVAQRMRALYEKEMRLKKWREKMGYPHCSKCGDITSRLHGENLICANCFASGMSEGPRGHYAPGFAK